MLIDIGPLKRNRDFRLLFIGQLISFLGSLATSLAFPEFPEYRSAPG
jgi:hypothetical protein